MIITIARQCGSGGVSIGKMVADHFEIPIYDKTALNKLAQKNGLYDKYSNFLDERTVNSLLYAISKGDNVLDITSTPKQVLTEVLGEQDCVLVGRCGNYVYKDSPDCTSVFLYGDLDKRVEGMMKRLSISEKIARKVVTDTDEERKTYHNYYTHEEWGAADGYDLSIDSFAQGFDESAKKIIAFVEGKK